MNGAFSANLDRLRPVLLSGNQGGQAQKCLPALFDFSEWCVIRDTYLSPAGDEGRGTWACIPAAALREQAGVLSPPGHKTLPVPLPGKSSVSIGRNPPFAHQPHRRYNRYNTLHLAGKVVCQRGYPFGNPGFVGVWPQAAILRPCLIPPKPKEAATPAHPCGLMCAASLYGYRAGTGEKTASEKLHLRVAIFLYLGYNKSNPNRRLRHEGSG